MLHFLYSCSDLSVLPDFVLCTLFACLLMQVSVCDIRTMRIPDRLNLSILVLGAARQIWHVLLFRPDCLARAGWQAAAAETGLAVLTGLLAASLPLYLIALAVPGSIGGGDIKLSAAAGVSLGWRAVLRGTAAGLVLGGFFAAGCLLLHKKKTGQSFPLGPFLASGYLYQMMCSS